MQATKRDVAHVLADLPKMCVVQNTMHAGAALPEGEPPLLLLRRGQSGYAPIYSSLSVDDANEACGCGKVTRPQVEAMIAGSIFGFDCPAADPLSYNDDGTLKRL